MADEENFVSITNYATANDENVKCFNFHASVNKSVCNVFLMLLKLISLSKAAINHPKQIGLTMKVKAHGLDSLSRTQREHNSR